MFYITFSNLWSLTYFFLFIYIYLIFTIIFYLLPITKEVVNFNKYKNNNYFEYLSGFDLHYLIITPLVLIFVLNFWWVSPSISMWFSHLIFSSFQNKITYLILFIFYFLLLNYTSNFYFSSREVYDYIIICFNFFFWLNCLFYCNTFFTFIFLIEILSTLIFLLLVSSTFSTTYFYNNLNLNLNSYFNTTTPFFYTQILIYFFWVSLISSLNLFFTLIIFYLKFVTFDWFFFEFLFFYFVNINSNLTIISYVFIWFNLLFCFFLKCGLVPFYFWKPVFFKNIPMYTLLFYITFFYFFIFLFLIYFLLVYVNEIFFFFININILLLMLGIFILLFVLCESFYIKSFLALSSIINTLFVFLALNSSHIVDFFFI